ncbi:MAG: efflux transporter outer membrane subunit [Gammaproteobacteria bacterium]|nr:efflux transporter outer membrane subunit [Gammaproteobacteria bacterium]MBT4605865.1 efflux transporter outer membrane subunit [Thiotrichales bacterium]MBT3471557.1 efflux transporter outer membrane subunit [Gammaproteobacteria bacterium]MBT3967875.1 efflux transporter outer membrane subunit [Gammaproteobacteria bacterium]MBT4081557.1 efflux transporter outer membrane subunit [Gammaproteobacteria bacterium]
MRPRHTVSTRAATLLTTLLLIGGCAHQSPPLVTPLPTPISTPQQWHALTTEPITASSEQGWLLPFNSPQLEALINQALQHNYSTERARLHLQSARQQSTLSRQALRPTTQGKISSGRSRTQSSGTTLHSSSHGLELSTTWEADLWQRLSDQQQATLTREEASSIDLKAARLSLTAEVTRNWFSAIESKQLMLLSEERLEQYRKAASIIKQHYSSGITDALDLHLARSEVAIAEERLASQQLEQERILRKLETLLGHYPAAELEVTNTLPLITTPIPAGLPSALLERRPDIEASHKRLQAAGLERTIAAKNRLPTLSLTAKGGTTSSELNNLLDWDYLFWNLLGNLTQPLFQQERLEAEEQLKQIAQQQAAVDYAETILQAFQEVENGLAADHYHQLRAAALERAAKESQQAATLALSRYQGGLVDILTLLDAQQRAYDRKSAHLQAIAARIDNRIQLHLALGGSY